MQYLCYVIATTSLRNLSHMMYVNYAMCVWQIMISKIVYFCLVHVEYDVSKACNECVVPGGTLMYMFCVFKKKKKKMCLFTCFFEI